MRLQQCTAAAAASTCLLLAAACGAAAATLADGSVNAKGQPLLTPSKLTMYGRSVFFEIPINVIGTLAMFHGCAHDASDFWPRATCAECDGLPEELAHTKQALARGYAVVAVDAADTVGRCFSWHADNEPAAQILRYFVKQYNLQSKPLYVVGVSSGAAFSLKLPTYMEGISGVISEVLGVLPEGWSVEQMGTAYPPTAFISMPRDNKTADRITQDMTILRRMGVPTDMLTVAPQQVTPNFISDRSDVLSPELSAQVAAALHAMGMLDDSGWLTQDPRKTTLPWRTLLSQAVPQLAVSAISLTPDASVITEALNLAYAEHEIVGDYVTACLAWLESRGTAPLAGLVQQFREVGLPGERLRDLAPARLGMLPMRVRQAAAM